MGEDFAARLLDEHYAIQGVLAPLPGERDRNFAVTAADGQRYVLKFTNAAQTSASVEMQTLAMAHLAVALPELPMPRIIPSVTGASSIRATLPSGKAHIVRLKSWLEGIPMDEARSTRNMAQPIGQCLARIDRALDGFAHSGGDYVLLWDMQHAAHLRALLSCIDDAPLRDTCARCLDLIDQKVTPGLSALSRQIIFGDLHPGNVLVAADNPERLAGIIDFGDMVRSYRIIDVAVACAYFCIADVEPFAPVLELLDTYSRDTPLAPDEVSLLPELIMARLLTTTMIAHWRASIFPENRAYIMGSEPHARELLGRMSPGALDRGREQFLDTISQVTANEA